MKASHKEETPAITTESTEGDDIEVNSEEYLDTWKAICDENLESQFEFSEIKTSN
jgi:hypothetical protein